MRIFLILFFVTTITQYSAFSQTSSLSALEENCIQQESVINFNKTINPSSNCQHTSPYWSDNSLYIPSGIETPIYVKLNFIFLTKPDGTGNFEENNSEHLQVIDDLINQFNWRLSTLTNTNQTGCSDGNPFVSDAKIQVIVNKIWMVDPAWNYLTTGFKHGDNPVNSQLYPPSTNYYYNYLDNNPNIPKGINVVFVNNGDIYQDLVVNHNYSNYVNDFPIEKWAASQFPTTSNLLRSSRQIFPDLFNKYIWMKEVVPGITNQPWSIVRSWFISTGNKTFPHEFGHSMGLVHDFCSVNLMNPSWNSSQNFLTPTEIGQMLRNASISNIRKYITVDSFTNTSFQINNNQVWDLDFRIYSDMTILNNSTLKLSCNLIVPSQNKIIVKDGSNLTIEGAGLNSANNTSWSGIKIEGNGSTLILPSTLINNGYFFAYTDNSQMLLQSVKNNTKLVSRVIDKPKNINASLNKRKQNISVYPNPFSNTFIIKSSNHSLLGFKVKVMNRQGVIVYQNIINKKINFINLPKLPSGIYFVTIEHKDGLEKRILIKE